MEELSQPLALLPDFGGSKPSGCFRAIGGRGQHQAILQARVSREWLAVCLMNQWRVLERQQW